MIEWKSSNGKFIASQIRVIHILGELSEAKKQEARKSLDDEMEAEGLTYLGDERIELSWQYETPFGPLDVTRLSRTYGTE